MKKSYLGILTSILFALVVLTIPALAVSDRASDQISGYYMVATPLQNGQIAIDFGVDATGKMTRLGADSIVVYEKEGSRWETVALLAPGRNSHFGCNRNRQFELR